jgi:transcription initiation factor TFIIIB Brf1 subunit/transcription initiation factor TFIIB
MSKALELYRDYVRGDESITNHGNPRVTAAAIYYIASVLFNTCHTQNDVCMVFKTSRVTLRKRYLTLCAKMGYIVLKPKPDIGFEPGEAGHTFTEKFYNEKWNCEREIEEEEEE